MRVRTRPLTATLGLAAVALLAVSGYAGVAAGKTRPLLTVGMCERPPAIDGAFAPGEWDQAACTTGLMQLGGGELVPVQPRFWMAFDQDTLYFAAATPLPRDLMPLAKHEARDSKVYLDDAIEFIVDPGQTRSTYFQFALNSAGAIFDARGGDSGWNAEGARCVGAPADGEWRVEFAVPFADLEAATPSEGERWGANVCLHCSWKENLLGTWAPVESGFREPANFGDLVFTRSAPVAALDAIEPLFAGHGQLTSRVHGNGDAASSLKIWPAAAEQPLVDIQRRASDTCTLPFALPEVAAGGAPAKYRGELRVTRAAGPLLICPFQLALASPLQMAVHAYVQDRRLEVEVTAGEGLSRPGEHSCRVTIAPKGGAATKTVEAPRLSPTGPTTVTFEAEDLPAKDITLTAMVLDKSGKTVLQASRELSDPLHPWWLDDHTGAQDVILPPYQPLKVTGAAIRPWGRSYRFGPALMPTEVITRDASVLAGPVELKVASGGQALTWSGRAPTIEEKKSQRVVLRGEAQCEALRLSGTVLVEYDGMIRVDLQLTPTGDAPADELTLEIPLKPEHAQLLYHFPGKWGSVHNVGALPQEGWTHAFKPYVWLGDNDRGFAWFCESAQNWLPEDREDAITVDREDGRVVLRLHLIDGEQITQPLKYTFGFEATPIKQPEKTVWDYRIMHGARYGMDKQPAQAIGQLEYPAAGNIRGDRGMAEMWMAPPRDSDAERAAEGDTSIPNFRFFWLDVDPQTNCGLFWVGPNQAVRIWVRVDGKVLTSLDAPVTWKRGELHHVAFSWGDELRIYIDGELRAQKPYTGLMPKDLTNATLYIGKGAPPLLVDEIRISDLARAPELDSQPYAPDEHTLLLDHLDLQAKMGSDWRTRPAVGHPGLVVGAMGSTEGKHGAALALGARRDGRQYTVLDQYADYGVRTLVYHSSWSWMGYPMVPPEHEQDLRDLVAGCHERGIQLLVYASPLTADEAPEWELYHKDFLVSPLKWPYRYREGHVAPACCWQSHYKNLWLARQARLIDEYDIDGFYLDGSEWPLWCENRHHGCGYVRRDGKIGQTCNIFATREYMKRLYVLCKTRKPDAQINIHNSTVMVIPTLGWGTSSWGGEQLGSLSFDKGGAVEKREYALDVLPLDAFRGEFMGRQWGVPSEFLCYERPYTTPQVLSITLLHHVLVRPNLSHLPRISAIWRLYDRFGMKDATWYPYWSNADIFRTNSPRIKVSAYRHPRTGLLMLVSNLSANETTARVRFDTAKLGLKPAGLGARDAISNDAITLSRGEVSFEMEPFSYRYVWVK